MTTLTSVSPETLREWTSQKIDHVVVDVRTGAEFQSAHIRGSYNVPLSLLSEHADEFADRLRHRVVLVCQSGVRAEQARQRLAAAGVEDAYVLDGGVPGYAAAGGDVIRGAARWDLERQVRFAAGSLVLLGLAGGRFLSPRLRLLAGGIGAGLAFSAATNTCAMGRALSAMPWNRAASDPTPTAAILQLPLPADAEAKAS